MAATRLMLKVLAALRGRASGSVKVSADLTGPLADRWRGLYAASEGLDVDDTKLLGFLLIQGGAAVRDALHDLPREG
jgi:hypothetical protein